MKSTRSICGLYVAAAFALPAPAQCPSWKPHFAPVGTSAPVWDTLVYDDGSGAALYAAGEFGAAGFAVARGVARWDGVTWIGVGSGIDVSAGEQVRALRVLDLGSGPRLYAVGSFANQGGETANGVAEWDGVSWKPLGSGPPLTSEEDPFWVTLAAFDSGSGPELFVGGSVYGPEFNRIPYLARWDGTSWSRITDGPGIPVCEPWIEPCEFGDISGLEVFDDGSGAALFAGGSFSLVGGAPGELLARFDGASWSAAPGTGPGGVRGSVGRMLLHDDGSGLALYLSGSFTGGPHARLIRYDGQAFSGLGAGPPGFVESMRVLPAAAGVPAGLWVAPLRPDLTNGFFTLAGWDGAQWTTRSMAMGYPVDVYTFCAFDGGAGAELVLGGDFPRPIGGVACANIARWSGVQWLALGSGGQGLASQFGSPAFVSALAVHDDGSGPALYAGGEIVWSAGHPLANLVRWNGASWTPIPGFTLPYLTHVDSLVSADLGQGPRLWIAGDLKIGFSNPQAVAFWDGTALNGDLMSWEGVDLAVYDAGNGPEVFLATTSALFRSSGAGFTYMTSVSNPRALAVHDDGSGPKLYVGGVFSSIAGVSARNVACWDGAGWSALGPGLGSGIWGEGVEVLISRDPGTGPMLYAGGRFASSGATAMDNLAKWNGDTWRDVGGGVGGTNARVHALAAFDDGSGDGTVLYVGGLFTSAGGTEVANLARFDGTGWEGPGFDVSGVLPKVHELLALELPVLGGRALAAGGDFDSAGGVAAQRIAVLEACTVGEVLCFGDGSGAPCGCGNEAAPGSASGCLNGLGVGAGLTAGGSTSIAADDLSLTASGITNQPGLFFQGDNSIAGGAGATFGDGIRCCGQNVVRIEIVDPVGPSQPTSISTSVSIANHAPPGTVNPGDTKCYQYWYRNSSGSPCGSNFNLSNAVLIAWEL